MNRHPRLWRHAILPVLCNLVLTIALLALLIFGGWYAFESLDAFFPAGFGWLLLEILAGLVIAVVILGLTAAAWILFQGILCGHFYSELAREVELQLGMKPQDLREVPLRYQIIDAVLDLGALVGVAAGCFVLGLIPVVGSIPAVVIGVTFDAWVFGTDYLDYPQALRARGRKVQREFARQHRATTLGLGASVLLISFVPILSSIVLTTAATGAVLLYRRLSGEESGAALIEQSRSQ